MPSAVELVADAVVPVEAADRHARNASLTLAFAQPGDTLLYLLLPLHHEVFGVSLAEVGLLLAANRLVRIAGYGWVARYYAMQGPRAACLLAAAGSALATLGYAFSSGLIALILAPAFSNISMIVALPTAAASVGVKMPP
jgi:MFS family permease